MTDLSVDFIFKYKLYVCIDTSQLKSLFIEYIFINEMVIICVD